MPISLFYRLLFVSELFIAEFLFIFRRNKRSLFPLRAAGCVLAGAAIACALPSVYNVFYTSFTFLLLFAMTLPMLWFCCKEPWINIFFCGLAAFGMQHFAYGMTNLLMSLIVWGQSPLFGMYFEGQFSLENFDNYTFLLSLIYLLAYFVSYTLLYRLFGKKLSSQKIKLKNTSVLLLVGAALIVDIVLNAVVVYFADTDNPIMMIINSVYGNLCCLFLLYIQFGLIRSRALEDELGFTERLLREKEQQYKLSKESISLINYKCHDLRHQIHAIGENKGLSDETIREIESAISIYDANIRTDNEVLDIILTEKSLKCAKEGVTLTCVADGRAIDFMERADVYSLFGNAIENAMEAVVRLPEDKRTIGIVLRRVAGMVSVNVHNYYDGKIAFDSDGLPVTTKGDRAFHGFGIRSMKQIAEKYKGTLSVSTSDHTFTLNILIPCR